MLERQKILLDHKVLITESQKFNLSESMRLTESRQNGNEKLQQMFHYDFSKFLQELPNERVKGSEEYVAGVDPHDSPIAIWDN